MAMVMMLVAALAAQEASTRHVRASEPKVLALFAPVCRGRRGSASWSTGWIALT
jgi:hypothetical protein